MRSRDKILSVVAISLSAATTASALMGAGSALAQSLPPGAASGHVSKGAGPSAQGGNVQRINMGVGKSIIVELPRDASEIFVGNPKVSNAVVRSARKVYLIGQANGQTTVFAIDSLGQRIATIEVNIGRDILELQQILRAAIADASIVARTVEDTIILTGEVASASDAQKAIDIATGFLPNQGAVGGTTTSGKIINSLTVRGREQVMVKVTISEVQRTVMKQLGVTAAQAVGGWGSFTMSNPLSQAAQVLDLGRAGTNGISATMRALERYGVARVLAEPTVTAVSGENAKFMAGGEVPIPSGNQCTTSQTGQQVCTPGGATFKPYGISLGFSPVVLSGGRILLRIATEVTEVDNSQAVTIGGTVVQGFRTRKNETTVELPSGGSIVSAGLLQVKSQQAINGLPALMNLPILGALFRSREYQRDETELMIVVTPYIVKPVNPSELVRPDDGFMEASDPQSWLLGRVNRLYSTTSNPQAARGFKGRIGFIVD